MALNYSKRLENLQARRFDPLLQKSLVTESFSKAQIPQDLKYLAESMQAIDNDYNDKTKTAANNVKTHLERDLQLSFTRDYRYQGSVMTKTNIKIYSDIDLLTLISDYSYFHRVLTEDEKYKGDAKFDINELRRQIINILKSKYDEVDDSGSKSISIYNKNLKRKVDIVPCYWYNSSSYEQNKDEYRRGVWLFDFDKNDRTKIDFPFAHIHNVDVKGTSTYDGLRKGIRLIKTLKADSDERITLSSFELTTIVYSIEESYLRYSRGMELTIAENISSQLKKMIDEPVFKNSVKSPNGTENPLTTTPIEQLKELKKDLDELIADCRSDLRNTYFEKGFSNY